MSFKVTEIIRKNIKYICARSCHVGAPHASAQTQVFPWYHLLSAGSTSLNISDAVGLQAVNSLGVYISEAPLFHLCF